MTDKNQQGLTLAFKKVTGKSTKIKELGITVELTDEEVDEVIIALAKAKAEREGTDWTSHVKGMRWYVEDLQTFSALNAEERLELEYKAAFAEIASEAEMLIAIQRQLGEVA